MAVGILEAAAVHEGRILRFFAFASSGSDCLHRDRKKKGSAKKEKRGQYPFQVSPKKEKRGQY
ncbi:MAG: hypothetical protein KY410_09745, partial [Proteobacteria bacterium]|nr:hypothetical protein [Pseudomonadota bacterium]